MADLGSLVVSIDANTKGLTKGLNFAKKSMAGFANIAKVGAVAAIGVATAAGAIAAKAAAGADEIDKMSQKIGISRKSYQEWDFILSQTGADVAVLQTGVKTLSRAADEANQGTASYAEAFDRLGLSVNTTSGEMKTQEDLLFDTILALSKMENQTERTAIASELLGRGATELAPLLNSGADSIEAMRKQANELGLVLEDDLIDAGVKFTDTLDQVKRSASILTLQLGGPFMAAFQNILDWALTHMPEIRKATEIAFGAIETAMKGVAWVSDNVLIPAFNGIKAWWEENGDGIKVNAGLMADGVGGYIQDVIDDIGRLNKALDNNESAFGWWLSNVLEMMESDGEKVVSFIRTVSQALGLPALQPSDVEGIGIDAARQILSPGGFDLREMGGDLTNQQELRLRQAGLMGEGVSPMERMRLGGGAEEAARGLGPTQEVIHKVIVSVDDKGQLRAAIKEAVTEDFENSTGLVGGYLRQYQP